MKAVDLSQRGLDLALLGSENPVVKLVTPAKEKVKWENGERTDKFDTYGLEVVLPENRFNKIEIKCERPSSDVLNLKSDELPVDVKLLGLEVSITYQNNVSAKCDDVVLFDQTRELAKGILGEL